MKRAGPRMSAVAAAMALAAASGLSLPGISEGQAYVATEEERKFLASLTGEPKRIWSRRFRRGLTAEEKRFIVERMKESL